MSVQRRRGPLATITPMVTRANNRGEQVTTPGTVTVLLRGALVNMKSHTLTAPGQLAARTAEFHTSFTLDPGITTGALVDIDGTRWEVSAPAVQRGSHRSNRYSVLALREQV